MATSNPVPSSASADLLYNAQRMDETLNSDAETFQDRLGRTRRTISGLERQFPDAESNMQATAADRVAVAADRTASEAAANQAGAIIAAASALPALSTASVDIATGRATVVDGAQFWVRPNATDGLLRYTAFTRLSATTQQFVTALMDATEFDSVFRTTDLSFRGLAPESGYAAGIMDVANRAALLFGLDGTTLPTKIGLPLAAYVLDDPATPLISRLMTQLSAQLVGRLGVMPPESGYSFALPGTNGRSPLSIDLDGKVSMPGFAVPADSVGLAALQSDVLDRLVPAVARRIVPEVVGAAPNRALYVNDGKTGRRALLTAAGDPRNPVVTGDAHVLFETGAGPMHSAIPSKGVFPLYPVRQVSCFGDSLTKSTGTDWPTTVMAPLLGVPCVNHGIAGQGTGDIMIRQGGWGPAVTLAGNQIPASGSVAATVSPSTGYRLDGSVTVYDFPGVLAGVPGTLTRNNTTGLWSFTRTASGAAVACPPGSAFVSDEGVVTRNDIQTIWVGRNNVTQATFEVDVLAAHTQGLAYLGPYVKRCVHISVTNGTAEGIGTANYNRIVALNQRLAELFGENYFDLRRYFIDHALTDAGIEPTEDDLLAITNDRPPPSIMADALHPTSAGYAVCGRAIANFIISKGWLL